MASLADPVYQLRKVGRDISKSFVNKLPRELTRCCFICVNSYRSFRQNIGVTPIQDAASLAKCVKYFEYEVFFVHNPHARTFIEYLTEVRLANAFIMLKKGHNLKSVAFDCGCKDYGYFLKVFKKKTGVTPLEYISLLEKVKNLHKH